MRQRGTTAPTPGLTWAALNRRSSSRPRCRITLVAGYDIPHDLQTTSTHRSWLQPRGLPATRSARLRESPARHVRHSMDSAPCGHHAIAKPATIKDCWLILLWLRYEARVFLVAP